MRPEIEQIVITCPPKMPRILARELHYGGFTTLSIDRMKVVIEGTFEDCMLLNLHLRTATRILYPIKRMRIHNADQLYHKVKGFAWEKVLKKDSYVNIDGFVKHSSIRDSRFAMLRVKDGVVDRLRKRWGRRPNTGPRKSEACIYLHWVEEQAILYIDTSGETISKHNYRIQPHKAPMAESLAASCILASQWQLDMPFINPMCGSGTLAIEAAMIASNTSPGLLRKTFGFMYWQMYDVKAWKDMVEAAKGSVERPEAVIIATDRDPKAIDAARENAQAAGMISYIEFRCCDFTKTKIPPKPSIIMLNPPYGERLGNEIELERLYSRIGDWLKQEATGHLAYIFTANLSLAKKIGLRASKRIEYFNAKLDSRLLEYELYEGSR